MCLSCTAYFVVVICIFVSDFQGCLITTIKNSRMMSSMRKRPFRVAIEGNIAAGKSTLIHYFQKQYSNVDTFQEPIKIWTNFKGNDMLQLLYNDLKRWNFLFQNFVQLERFKIQTTHPSNPNVRVQMYERTVQNNHYCFGKMAYEQGYLTEPEYLVSACWLQTLKEIADFSVDLIVYIRCSPETCYERVKARGRIEEESIDLNYLTNCHEMHDKWLMKSETKVPVIVIDSEKSLAELEKEYSNYSNYILGIDSYKKQSGVLSDKKTYFVPKELKSIRVAIEGNIGCGKSSLIDYIKAKYDIDTYKEPLTNWCNLGGHNLLKLLYSDLNRWNFLFRSYVQLTLFNILLDSQKNSNSKVQIFERSAESNRFCFMEHAYSKKFLTKAEYDVLINSYETLQEKLSLQMDVIIYLQSTPEECFKRVKLRGREGEQNIPLQYFEELHAYHEEWLINGKNHKDVYVINVDQKTRNEVNNKFDQFYNEHFINHKEEKKN